VFSKTRRWRFWCICWAASGDGYWHLYVYELLHYRMTLRTVLSDCDVRTRLTAFRVDLGTCYVTICVVSCLLQEGVGVSAIRWGAWSADCGGGGGGRKIVNRKRMLSAVFLQPIQNPSYMSHVLLLCISFLHVLVVLYLCVTCICVA
jgi:hypothetical protein